MNPSSRSAGEKVERKLVMYWEEKDSGGNFSFLVENKAERQYFGRNGKNLKEGKTPWEYVLNVSIKWNESPIKGAFCMHITL